MSLSALGQSDSGHPVVGAAALLAEQAQLVQSWVLPRVCTGALQEEKEEERTNLDWAPHCKKEINK